MVVCLGLPWPHHKDLEACGAGETAQLDRAGEGRLLRAAAAAGLRPAAQP